MVQTRGGRAIRPKTMAGLFSARMSPQGLCLPSIVGCFALFWGTGSYVAHAQGMFSRPSINSSGGAGQTSLLGGSGAFGFGGSSNSGTGFNFGNSNLNSSRSGQTFGGTFGQTGGQSRQTRQFVGADRTDAVRFSGTSSSRSSGFFSPSGGSNTSRTGQFMQRMLSEMRRFQAEPPKTNSRIPIRTHVTPKFSHPASAPDAASGQLTRSLQALQRGRSANSDRIDLQVTLSDRTAILTGVVPTEDDRRLAARLALLEPGISQVRNEITVQER